MDIESKIAIFEEKIEEYFLSCLPSGIQHLEDKSRLQEWPLYKFNIQSIYQSIQDNKRVPQDLIASCVDKLIDIKLVFCYLNTTTEYFYRGPTLIVGNNEIEKLNPDTISLLRENHYKVYLISIMVENILDFFVIVFRNRIADYKRGKWKKILDDMLKRGVIPSVNDENVATLLAFKKKYRTAELHKFSAVRAFTAKEKWDHFQTETNIVRNIILDLTSFFEDRKT